VQLNVLRGGKGDRMYRDEMYPLGSHLVPSAILHEIHLGINTGPSWNPQTIPYRAHFSAHFKPTYKYGQLGLKWVL